MRKRGSVRARRRHAKLIKWLSVVLSVILPPVGVILAWRSSWSTNMKYALTILGVACAALIVVLIPSPDARVNGGVTLVGIEQDTEVYGPDMPTAMVTADVTTSDDSVLAEATEEPDTEYVYAMAGATYYHTSDCRYAYDSAQKLTVYEAHFMGYEPCPDCNPPEYEEGTF